MSADGAEPASVRPFTLARAIPPGDVFKADLEKQVGVFRAEQILTASLVDRALDSDREISEGSSSEAPSRRRPSQVEIVALDTLTVPADRSSLLASFLRGLALYRKGSIEDAAKEFRASVGLARLPRRDSLPRRMLRERWADEGSGRRLADIADRGDASPEIFALVADGYLRMGDAEAAADMLVEAGTKWPEDERFIVRSALARAAAGHPG